MDTSENTKDNFDQSLNIAIIGMSGRFPGAADIDAFWKNLCAGVETIQTLSDDELKKAGVSQAELDDPDYVKVAAPLNDVDLFDAAFFDYSPVEASIMDPQQRLLLECAWQALENAGYAPGTEAGRIGVFAGAKMNSYIAQLFSNPGFMASQDRLQIALGNDASTLSARISYKLNLTGPSYMLQTACSTSLVAVHLACQSLLLDECRLALAGAAAIDVPQTVGYRYQYGGILSPDGHCRPFDAKAKGTVFGSGVGFVVLKRLQDALEDGDTIYAVIKGTATNNDGAEKASFTAPSVEGQTDVIIDALACSGVDIDTISYVETHGTGTYIGDPIEIMALTNAFRAGTNQRGFCRIGSVKGNVGHLDAAAGMASLVKTIMALKHKIIPPSLYFEKPNPEIDFVNGPFVVNTQLTEWKNNGKIRRAGVSAFGFGGANSHLVLEEAPERAPVGQSKPVQMLTLSARTSSALEAMTANLAAHLKQNPDLNLADVAYTLQVGRRAFDYRRVVVCSDTNEAIRLLETGDAARVFSAVRKTAERPIVFMFPGQGSQYINMAKGLYEKESLFREQVDLCIEKVKPYIGFDLRSVIYPASPEDESASRKLEQTDITQLALFTIEYALAQLWMSWGITPQAMIGHSLGEYVAACLAGVFSLDDALRLVATRGRLMQAQPAGGMLSVALSAEAVAPFLTKGLSLAAVNAPSLCVVSGPTEAIAALEKQLAAQEIVCSRLHTSHAFHSEMMEPMLAALTDEVKRVRLSAPHISYLSNVTGTWITDKQALDPSYWATHVRQSVRFADGIHELLSNPQYILLEVGPGQTLSALARQQIMPAMETAVFPSMRHPKQTQPDLEFLLTTLGRLWLAGERVDWTGFHADEPRRRLPLPTYPFERQRYWVDGQSAMPNLRQVVAGKTSNVEDWFFVPGWQETPLRPAADLSESRAWLIFLDESGLGTALVERLRNAGQKVAVVSAGKGFDAQEEDSAYTLDPKNKEDYIALVRQLKSAGQLPDVIAHLWNVTPDDVPVLVSFAQAQDFGFYSLLFLAQALAQEASEKMIRIGAVANHLQEVSGNDPISPEKATLLGPVKVIPQEHENLACVCMDIELPAGTRQRNNLLDQLVAELTAEIDGVLLAYRGNRRWVETYLPAPLKENDLAKRPLRERGVYWITGGLGNVAYQIGQYLARTVKARLVLSSRSRLPPRAEWDSILAQAKPNDGVASKIRRVQALEALGAEVMVASANAADEAQARALVNAIYARFGTLDGVFHAAGLTSGDSIYKPLVDMGRAEAEMQFQPKAGGAYTLEKVLADKELDFCLLFSSSSVIFGGLGYVTYTASNAFLDAFAHQRNRDSGFPWISANWDPWPEDVKPYEDTQTSVGQYAMTPEESEEAFRRVTCLANEGQVAVITGDLPSRYDMWITRAASKERVMVIAHERPALSAEFVAPRTETESKVAEIWSRMLGVKDIGVNDNFFELGGHSLLITQVINQVRQTFKVELPIRSLFEQATVAGVAQLIESGRGQVAEAGQKPIAERLQVAFPTEKAGLIKDYLKQKIALALNMTPDGLPQDGRLDSGDLEKISIDLIFNLQRDLGVQAFPQEISRLTSLDVFTRFVQAEIDRRADPTRLATQHSLSFYTLQPYRKHAYKEAPSTRPAQKNDPIVFIHSSPRAGSTLLRIMLAGHPNLFCPPELHLLYFDAMNEWHANLGFGDELTWTGKGLEWAFVELMGIEADESQKYIDTLVEKNEPVPNVYKQLQEGAGGRLLVDKTPTYSLDPETLTRSERLFELPKYIHLVRHPYAVIESFIRIRLDKLFGPNMFREKDVDPYVIAETVWATANRNLLEFLEQVDPERHHLVRYEDMVSDPRTVMTGLCNFLGIPFHEAVLTPYDGRRERMTGGLGDPNIFQHKQIDPALGEAWKKVQLPRLLDKSTVEIAAKLGYTLPQETGAQATGKQMNNMDILANLDNFSAEEVAAMLGKLLAEEDGGNG